jgi:uncharacterized protein YjbI with pentapeptide repeats
LSSNRLLAAGARNTSNDWSYVYCKNCRFPANTDLTDARFDGSVLNGGILEHLRLSGSSFQRSDLAKASFAFSDLTGARLSGPQGLGRSNDSFVLDTLRDPDLPYPFLRDAVLNGAILDAPLLVDINRYFSVKDGKVSIQSTLSVPDMEGVTINQQTQLKGIDVRLTVHFDKTFYSSLSDKRNATFEDAINREELSSFPQPFAQCSSKIGAITTNSR